MLSNLKVKDFGPIKFVDLDLRNVNVFIGPQASGKSALAKIYTIFKAPRKFLKNSIQFANNENIDFEKLFKETLEEYNISSFIKPQTEIEYNSLLHSLIYKEGTISYEPKLLKQIEGLEQLGDNFSNNIEVIKKRIKELTNDFFLFEFKVGLKLHTPDEAYMPIDSLKKFKELSEETFYEIISIIKEIEVNLSTNAALYIPAERNFINIIKNAALNLINNNVPIPKHILLFGAELEKANIKEIDLDFLSEGLVYKSINGEDRIFTDQNNSIKLTEGASGVQSVLPILIPMLFSKNDWDHRSFVIEEPELNLFPIAQYELIKYLESKRREAHWEDYGTIHTYTTHSPYILSAINNLLYANKVKSSIPSRSKEEKEGLKRDVERILKADINPFYLTAYQISNGGAESILNRDTGLIDENFIDKASDKLGEDFDSLMEIFDEYKRVSV